MSATAVGLLNLSTRNLSADGTQVLSGDEARAAEVSIESALDALRAFAALPAMALIDVEAKIYLAGPRGKVAVQNVGGKLFVAQVPEAVNTAFEHTAEETIALVTAEEFVSPTVEAEVAAAVDDAVLQAALRTRGWRGKINSPWLLAVLLVIANAMAFFSFVPQAPSGVSVVRDPARVAALNAEFNGRYGNPAAMMLQVQDGTLAGKQALGGTREEKLFERKFRFGLRGTQVVLLVDNGAIVTAEPDHRLVFLDSSYPRLAK